MGYFNEGRNRFGALILILLGAVLAGCDEKGGKTTDTDSAGFTTLAEKKAFIVQYHPEATPGPSDSAYLFKRFFEMVVS